MDIASFLNTGFDNKEVTSIDRSYPLCIYMGFVHHYNPLLLLKQEHVLDILHAQHISTAVASGSLCTKATVANPSTNLMRQIARISTLQVDPYLDKMSFPDMAVAYHSPSFSALTKELDSGDKQGQVQQFEGTRKCYRRRT